MTARKPVRGGLKLRVTPTVSERKELDITSRWLGTADEVDEELSSYGFRLPSQPGESPEPVTAQTLIGSTPEQYAEAFTLYLRWYNYATPLKAKVEAKLLGYNNALDELSANIRSELRAMNKDRSKKMSDKEMRDIVEEDQGVRDLKYARQRWQQLQLRIDAQLKTISKNMAVISRVQEERRNEVQSERRDTSIRNAGRFRR